MVFLRWDGAKAIPCSRHCTGHGMALCDSARYFVLSGPVKFIRTRLCLLLLLRRRRGLREMTPEIHGPAVS